VKELAFHSRRIRALLAVLAALTVAAGLTTEAARGYPNPGTVAGSTVIHDPSMAIRPSAPRYVVFGTHNQTLLSNDRVTFSSGGPFLPTNPSWWQPYSNGDVWAPDVSFHNGQYWLYYAVSTFGSQYSAIGLATSPTALPGSWTDQGVVFSSHSGDNYNAIDPNLLVDASGNWWLVFGSFWHGIYMISLNPTTGKPSGTPTPTHLAERPGVSGDPLEGAFVYQHHGYYYLFASYDYCCRGTSSTYNIRVGRSTSPTGPYTDESGASMLNGGGTTILASHGYVIGPGGQSVYFDTADNHDLLTYHYYDSRLNGEPFLGINFLGWDVNDFPYVY
jgi:arabinan endo-1,5-alpha-L-arabinosidase